MKANKKKIADMRATKKVLTQSCLSVMRGQETGCTYVIPEFGGKTISATGTT